MFIISNYIIYAIVIIGAAEKVFYPNNQKYFFEKNILEKMSLLKEAKEQPIFSIHLRK